MSTNTGHSAKESSSSPWNKGGPEKKKKKKKGIQVGMQEKTARHGSSRSKAGKKGGKGSSSIIIFVRSEKTGLSTLLNWGEADSNKRGGEGRDTFGRLPYWRPRKLQFSQTVVSYLIGPILEKKGGRNSQTSILAIKGKKGANGLFFNS